MSLQLVQALVSQQIKQVIVNGGSSQKTAMIFMSCVLLWQWYDALRLSDRINSRYCKLSWVTMQDDRKRPTLRRNFPQSSHLYVGYFCHQQPALLSVCTRRSSFHSFSTSSAAAYSVLITIRYGIVGFNVPLDTLQVISETILQVRWPNKQCNSTEGWQSSRWRANPTGSAH